jgi:amino acid adenylation domain-containing protein
MSNQFTTMNAVQNRLVQSLVAAQAQERPDSAALVTESATLSYAELDRRSNQFANYLQTLGVGPEKVVALCVDRSPQMVVAALGILKAGGAYLPLDPSAPAERMELMLRDADVAVLVTNQLARLLPAGNARVVDLDKDTAAIEAASAEAPVVSITPENLAYVIYTSGSTGQPKGVEVTHSGLANLVSWHLRAFNVTTADRASHQAALGFDAAVWEVWPYLASGASVYFPEDGVRSDPEALRDWLVEHKITITFVATPLAERMMLLDWPSPGDLRILLTGADTLHRRPSSRVPFTLVNNYGPTECTVVATSGTVSPAESSSEVPTIGRAIDNAETFVLDENMRRVPAGKPGELYIGGAGLARGYRNRPDITAEKFVANPFATNSSERLYRTGDLVRELPSGELEFLGRIDTQIKIRGYRVEPNEIVQSLNASADVEASVVVANEDDAGDKRLVAYVVLAASANGVTGSALRAELRKQLPDYMIPATFVRIDALPVTSNGKVDLAALPVPKNGNVLADEQYVAPESIVDQKLAAIIAPLLHVERVGLHDNFFFLGGHSLLGTQLISKISETFGVELSLLNLFDHPTLAEMSQEIEQLILAKVGAMGTQDEYTSSIPRRGDAA